MTIKRIIFENRDYDLNLTRHDKDSMILSAYALTHDEAGNEVRLDGGPQHSIELRFDDAHCRESIDFLIEVMDNGEWDVDEILADEREFIDNFVKEEDAWDEFVPTEYDGWHTADGVYERVFCPELLLSWIGGLPINDSANCAYEPSLAS